MTNEFKQYKRKGLSEMRPYESGEDLSSVSVSETDDPINDMGMIARNPKNHLDQWYVARKYFNDNLELVSELPNTTTTDPAQLHLIAQTRLLNAQAEQIELCNVVKTKENQGN